MKMIPFILTLLGTIVILHIYICTRAYQSLEYIPTLRIPVIAIIILLIITFVLNMSGIMIKIFSSEVVGTISFFASSWLFILMGIFISVLFIDIVRVLNHFIGFYPLIIKENYVLTKFIVMTLTISTTIIWYIMGYLNFITPQKTELDVFINKPQIINDISINNNLKIVHISDVHMGYIINKKKLRQYIDSVNAQEPDIVLITGDLFDGAIEPVIDQKMYEELTDIKTKLGVYVVTGNHEYIGGNKDVKVEYLKKSGLVVLEDSIALVDNRFYIVGRNDRSAESRKTTQELVQGIDKSKPIILLDHQPYNLDESESAGVDLHLSGHTHDGQFFPINLITNAVYEVSAGYKLKGNTHIYVSSGLGLWGPPVRLGTKSEFVVINMRW